MDDSVYDRRRKIESERRDTLRALADMRRKLSAAQALIDQKRAEKAGESWELITRSAEEAIRCAGNQDWQIREIAVGMLRRHCTLRNRQHLAQVLVRIARDDPVASVRGAALLSLADLYHGTDDVASGEVLAKAVLDERESIVDVRVPAYYALHGASRTCTA